MSIDAGTTFIKIKRDGTLRRNPHKATALTVGGNAAGNHSDMDLIYIARQRVKNQGGTHHKDRIKENLKNGREKASALLATSYKGPESNGMTLVKTQLEQETNCLPKIFKQYMLGKSPNFQRSKLDSKSYCLDTSDKKRIEVNSRIRRLTPAECSRLQTIPDWYLWDCSDTQIYRMLGNGWTVEVIKHIFSFLPSRFQRITQRKLRFIIMENGIIKIVEMDEKTATLVQTAVLRLAESAENKDDATRLRTVAMELDRQIPAGDSQVPSQARS